MGSSREDITVLERKHEHSVQPDPGASWQAFLKKLFHHSEIGGLLKTSASDSSVQVQLC
jgi:hypothetical protein